MDRRERGTDIVDAMLASFRGLKAEMWNALPGIVVSFNADAQTCEVQPAIKAQVRDPQGVETWVTLPVLPDVPVIFPRAGGFALTFPIVPGDEVLVMFSSRCIDAWWQSGGVQQQVELRMHDLSDGFCIAGPTSQPRRLSNVSTSAVQLRNDAGDATVSILPTGEVRVHSASKILMQAPDIALEGNVTIIGNTEMNGELDQHSGAVNMEGPVEVTSGLTADGIPYVSHRHVGVRGGPDTSGGPVP